MVEVAKTTSDYHFDDSRLGRAKELVSELRTRLDVELRLVNAEGQLHGEIPLDAAETENIVEQVTEYFGSDNPADQAVALRSR